MKKNLLVSTALGLSGIAAAAGLAFGVMTWLEFDQQIRANARNFAATDQMAVLARTDELLHLLNSGQVELAKIRLTENLGTGLTALDSLSAQTHQETRDFAQFMANQIAREEKAHPDCYPVTHHPTRTVAPRVP